MSKPGKYLNLLQALEPPGPAWNRDIEVNGRGNITGSTLTLFLAAIADSLERLDRAATTLIKEANPRTASQMLEARYDEAGLPLACLPRADRPRLQRSEVLYSWAAYGGASAQYFSYLLERLEIPYRIREFSPFRVETQPVESQPLYGDEWAYWWQVSAVDTTYQHFAVGESTVSEPLQRWGLQSIICLINTLKPAHTGVIFRFVLNEDELDIVNSDFGIEGLVYEDSEVNFLTDDSGNPIYIFF